MNCNSWDDEGLDHAAMYYAHLHPGQQLDPQQVVSAEALEDRDTAHPTLVNLAGISEVRSWAVQPVAPFWRERGHACIAAHQNVTSDPKAISRLIRWIRFNAVGALGIAVQMAALFLLKSVLHLHYLLATAFAVEAAIMHNFFWHERYTWLDRARSAAHAAWKRMLRFNLTTGGVSIVGNLVLMKLFAGMAHINYFVANLLAIALCSLANFVASDEWVFGES